MNPTGNSTHMSYTLEESACQACTAHTVGRNSSSNLKGGKPQREREKSGRVVSEVFKISANQLCGFWVWAERSLGVPRLAFPKTLHEFQSMFAAEAACQKYLAECRWPDGFICPRCGNRSSYEFVKLRRWQCSRCRYQISLTEGTILPNTYTTRQKVVDIGPIHATREETHNVPLPPIAGAVALSGGVVLLVAPGKE